MLFGFTTIVPVIVAGTQPPLVTTVNVYVPVAVGVPLIVTTFAAQLPFIPGGNPVMVAPVAMLVLYFICVATVLIHTVCESVPAAELNTIVSSGFT